MHWIALGIGNHPCPFCTRGYVNHRCHDCPVLANVIVSGYAYKYGKIDPHRQPFFGWMSFVKPIFWDRLESQDREVIYDVWKGYGRGNGGGRLQSYAMTSVLRAATPPTYVPRDEVHKPLNGMLLLDIRRATNDVRSGARGYYEGLEVEEHGHALVTSPVERAMIRKEMLKQNRGFKDLAVLDSELQRIRIGLNPMLGV